MQQGFWNSGEGPWHRCTKPAPADAHDDSWAEAEPLRAATASAAPAPIFNIFTILQHTTSFLSHFSGSFDVHQHNCCSTISAGIVYQNYKDAAILRSCCGSVRMKVRGGHNKCGDGAGCMCLVTQDSLGPVMHAAVCQQHAVNTNLLHTP